MRFINRFTRALVAAGALFGASIGLAHAAGGVCEPARLATKYPGLAGKTIKVGQDGESAPFSMRDPKNFEHLLGLDADMARAVFGCAGVPITFTTGSWSGLIPALMAGQIDVMWDQLLYTPERAKKLDFVAYMQSATGVIVAKGNPKQLKSLKDANVCGLTMAANLGTTQEALLREANTTCTAAGKAPINIMLSADVPSGLRLVQSGRADGFLTNKFAGDAMVAASPGNIDVAFDITTGAKLAAGVAKGNPDLLRAISDSLGVLSANGTLKRLFADNHVDYALAIPISTLTH